MTGWNRKAVCFALAAALLPAGSLTGCGGTPAVSAPPASAVPGPEETPAVSASPAPSELPDGADPLRLLLPRAGQERVEENEKAAVDYSFTQEGYIMARRGSTEKKLKLRITGQTEYTYDLTGEDWTAFPLSDGDGRYTVSVFEQVEETAYTPILTLDFDVELEDIFSPFLRPNQQVDYADSPLTLAKAAELTEDAYSDREKVANIYAFVSTTLVYDDQWAEAVRSGYIPVLDEVLQKEKGICLDFAALMTAMVRSRRIPCRLVVGDAGKLYHAWVEAWDGEEWVRFDPTFAASGKDVSGVEYSPKFYY